MRRKEKMAMTIGIRGDIERKQERKKGEREREREHDERALIDSYSMRRTDDENETINREKGRDRR